MVTNTTATMEVVDTGERRDGRGRKLTPAARRQQLVAVWRESGLTQAAFARREGINYTTWGPMGSGRYMLIWVEMVGRDALIGAWPGDFGCSLREQCTT